jgi:uncharacterized protein (TIGR00297 family)
MGGFALLLRVLTWWQAAALAGVALAFNALVLPRIGGALYRPGELARGTPAGILLYPLAVLLLILAFPRRLDIAGAAWGILAVGDGAATLVGRRIGGRRWPWNRDKTIAGTTAFFVFGSLAGVALARWIAPAVTPAPGPLFIVLAPMAAALVAAAVETLPIRLDDNVSVAATSAAVLWCGSLVTREAWEAAWPAVAGRVMPGAALNLAVAWLGWRAATVTAAGAVGGAIIGTVVFACTGGGGWTLLVATFLAASVSSRLGLERKMLLGIAEARRGRRGVGNAVANTGVAACAAVLAAFTPFREAALLALVAALAAGGSDTVASEIGKAWGRRTFLVTTLSRVPPGTSGAISLEGTTAGVVSALALAWLGQAVGLIPAPAVAVVVIGATAGAFLESALGATLEGPGILDNDALNFINAAASAMVAVSLWQTV